MSDTIGTKELESLSMEELAKRLEARGIDPSQYKSRQDALAALQGAYTAHASGSAKSSAPPSLPAPSDVDAQLGPPIPLSRQQSERTDGLARVGLGEYRDELVNRGLTSLQDLKIFNDTELQAMGMDSTQRYIFHLFAEKESAVPSGRGGSNKMSPSLTLAAGHGECMIGSDRCTENGPTALLPCCDLTVCHECLRGQMVQDGEFLQCPNFVTCKGLISPEASRSLFQNHCCCCGHDLHRPADPTDTIVSIECGFGHCAHRSCLRRHVAEAIALKVYPITCPANRACKCLVSDRTVRDLLKGGEHSSDGGGEASPRTDVAMMEEGEGTQLLVTFYQMAYDHAISLNGFLRECPDATCKHQLDLRPGAGARLPDSRDVRCSACHQDWCSICWLQGHPGYNCSEFEEIKSTWMEFLESQGTVSEDVRAELEKFRVLRLDEQYKANHQRHCPHCGLVAQWTDGCSQMTCGRDAQDKGGKIHSQLGCGKDFNWDRARPYKPRFQEFKAGAGTGSEMIQTSGVVLPSRLCRLCFTTVHEGTCFEELASQAQRLNNEPHALLEYVQLKTQRVQRDLEPAAVFVEAVARDGVASLLKNLLKAVPAEPISALPLDDFGNTCTLTLKADAFDGGRLAKIRVHCNAPRFKQNAPDGCLVTCAFSLTNIADPDIRERLQGVAGQQETLSVEMPLAKLPKRRGWGTLLNRQSIVKALQKCCGRLSSLDIDVVLGALHRVHFVFALAQIVQDPSNVPTACGLEQIEITTCPPLPRAVRDWLQHRETNPNANTPEKAAVDGQSTLLDSLAMKLCVCWPCMRIKLAGADITDENEAPEEPEDDEGPAFRLQRQLRRRELEARQQQQQQPNTPTGRFQIGTMVTLSSTYQSPANIDAADGPLRRGGNSLGIVVKVQPDSYNLPQPVLVRAFNGAAAWYAKGALVTLPEPCFDQEVDDSLGNKSGKIFDATSATTSLEAFAMGVDDTGGGACRIVQPLTTQEVQQKLEQLNRSVVQVPDDLFPSSFVPGGVPVPATSESTSFKEIANRLNAVTQVVNAFRHPAVDKFARVATSYLQRLISKKLAARGVSKMVGKDGSVNADEAQTLQELRRVCCESVAIASRWMGDATAGADESQNRAAAVAYRKAFAVYEQVRDECLALGYKQGPRPVKRPTPPGLESHDAAKQQAAAKSAGSAGGRSPESPTLADTPSSDAETPGRDPRGRWSCAACTMENSNVDESCQVCGGTDRGFEIPPDPAELYAAMVGDHGNGAGAEAGGGGGEKAGSLDHVAPALIEQLTKLGVSHEGQAHLVRRSGIQNALQLTELSLEEVECYLEPLDGEKVHLSQEDFESLRPLLAAALPCELSRAIAERGVDGLSPTHKLWLELELQSPPTVPCWSRAPGQIDLPYVRSDRLRPAIQNLQQGDFAGDLSGFVLRSASKNLSDLWLLLVERPNAVQASVRASYAIGDRVVTLDDNTAMVLLEQPIHVRPQDTIVFTCVTRGRMSRAAGLNRYGTLTSPEIRYVKSNGIDVTEVPSFVGCGPSCNTSHRDHGACLVCGLDWGRHNGHNCRRLPNGIQARGSWAAPGGVRGTRVTERSHVFMMARGAGAAAPAAADLGNLGVTMAAHAPHASRPWPAALQVRLFGSPSTGTRTPAADGALLSAVESLRMIRGAIRLCTGWALTATRVATEPHPDACAPHPISHFPGDEALWLVRENWLPLCVQCGPKDNVDADENFVSKEMLQRLDMGDHVLARHSETDGFTERAVVFALKVSGAPETNTNKMVVYSAESSSAAGFIPVQCPSEDLIHVGPRAVEWQYVPQAIVKHLRQYDAEQASEAANIGRTSSGGGGGAKTDGLDGLFSLDDYFSKRSTLFERIAPFLLENRDAIGIEDFEWFVKTLETLRNESDDQVLASMQLHLESLKEAAAAMKELTKACERARTGDGRALDALHSTLRKAQSGRAMLPRADREILHQAQLLEQRLRAQHAMRAFRKHFEAATAAVEAAKTLRAGAAVRILPLPPNLDESASMEPHAHDCEWKAGVIMGGPSVHGVVGVQLQKEAFGDAQDVDHSAVGGGGSKTSHEVKMLIGNLAPRFPTELISTLATALFDVKDAAPLNASHTATALFVLEEDTRDNEEDTSDTGKPLGTETKYRAMLDAAEKMVRSNLVYELFDNLGTLARVSAASLDNLGDPVRADPAVSQRDFRTELHATIRQASTALLDAGDGILTEIEMQMFQRQRAAASLLRSRLDAAVAVRDLACSFAATAGAPASNEMTEAIEDLKTRFSIARGSMKRLKRAEASGGMVNTDDAADSAPAGDVWDCELSCADALTFSGDVLRKKQGRDVAEYATAFLAPTVTSAELHMVQVASSAVYIGVAMEMIPKDVGLSSSSLDNTCWYMTNEGHLRCGSETMLPNRAGNSGKFRTGDTLTVEIEQASGIASAVHFSLQKADNETPQPRLSLPLAPQRPLNSLRFVICVDRGGDAVEVRKTERLVLQAPADTGGGAAKVQLTPQEKLLDEAATWLVAATDGKWTIADADRSTAADRLASPAQSGPKPQTSVGESSQVSSESHPKGAAGAASETSSSSGLARIQALLRGSQARRGRIEQALREQQERHQQQQQASQQQHDELLQLERQVLHQREHQQRQLRRQRETIRRTRAQMMQLRREAERQQREPSPGPTTAASVQARLQQLRDRLQQQQQQQQRLQQQQLVQQTLQQQQQQQQQRRQQPQPQQPLPQRAPDLHGLLDMRWEMEEQRAAEDHAEAVAAAEQRHHQRLRRMLDDEYLSRTEALAEPVLAADEPHLSASFGSLVISGAAGDAEAEPAVAADEPASTERSVNIDTRDIALVQQQAHVDAATARAALIRQDGDIVNAIMELSS